MHHDQITVWNQLASIVDPPFGGWAIMAVSLMILGATLNSDTLIPAGSAVAVAVMVWKISRYVKAMEDRQDRVDDKIEGIARKLDALQIVSDKRSSKDT